MKDKNHFGHLYHIQKLIDLYSFRVCVHRVVPCLAKEFVNPHMIPFVLPSVLAIAEEVYINELYKIKSCLLVTALLTYSISCFS